jgi:hypothetical protein
MAAEALLVRTLSTSVLSCARAKPIKEAQSYGSSTVPARFRSDFTSVSTNFTASNLVGAGRGIGKLYSRGGRILERAISTIAHRLGFGPYAVSLRIIGLLPEKIYFHMYAGLSESETRTVTNGIVELWKYIECVPRHTVY